MAGIPLLISEFAGPNNSWMSLAVDSSFYRVSSAVPSPYQGHVQCILQT